MEFEKLTKQEQESFIQQAVESHRSNQAHEKYHKVVSGSYLKDMVYGAIDGIVTTFAVVAGVAGAALELKVVLILGFANLIADGLSMAIGNFLGTRSENQFLARERMMEEWEVEHIPQEERKEIAAIYRGKGFGGESLDQVVAVITANKKVWVDEMMVHELGMAPEATESPSKKGLATFIAFIIAGFLPIAPYAFGVQASFVLAMVMTAVALFTVGSLRTYFTKQHWLIAGFEMLGVGALAAAAAYGVGYLIEALV